ncbi:hypothetical protein JK361_31230 [Streptomyces sp. 5-8]|uniref:Uncharacterized protein n=1 Tax=Streptomyces musisoli TaxID=2802280 RepID=A0ABS1P9F5_9ACTN|nr:MULTISPECIES: hypothetical protein [Streptomyces]MBL1109007.1 hypothetical protein [Streptomyces musisoli]MBY8845749.1 hypothetical protein [Streptomyces sp. SP2-10]
MGRTAEWAAKGRGLFGKLPYWSSRGELGPWEQREVLRARITELEAVLDAISARAQADPERSDLAPSYVAKARLELDAARDVLAHRAHPMMRRAAHLGVARSHLDVALNLMVWTASLDDVKALLPDLAARVDEHFAPRDPRRIRVREISQRLNQPDNRTLEPSERAFLADTVSLARRLLRKETLRVRSFVRIVRLVTIGLGIAAIAVAWAGCYWDDMVPLCFTPEYRNTYSVVCPTRTVSGFRSPPGTGAIAEASRPADYLVVELVGLVSAGIASAAALRRIRGTALPYGVPVVLALLKLPTGALTAVLGLLLMRGGFVPGLSALDSTAQIIAWSVILGYSQQVFTRSVDSQGQAVLDSVRGPQSRAKPGEDGRS